MLLPILNLLQPSGGGWSGLALHAQLHQPLHAQAQITKHGHLSSAVFAHFGRIDLEVNHLGPWRKRIELSGDAIIETRPHGNQ